uniref:vacuolar protein sorting-associated protein 2 homolog 1-like n=1 Tax=Erigeron canadensis TaxID=72917 RepID=UPI001CB99A43|nr:vacuolar protein sorting-associated protein 2 homolog 1-like [Erigeron canadensis]
MWSIFGKKKKTAQDVLEEKKKRLDKCRAKIEKQRQGFLDHEKELLAEIKKEAEQGNMDIAKIKAREVVMTRHHIEKFNKLESTLQGVSLKTQAKPSEPKTRETKGDGIKGDMIS